MCNKSTIHRLTSQTYVLLPLSDVDEFSTDDITRLSEYCETLLVQYVGERDRDEFLSQNADFNKAENIIRAAIQECHSVKSFKREIKKALSLLNKIESSLGDDDGRN